MAISGFEHHREFPEQLGKQLVELVLKRIAKPDQAPQCVMIPTEFIKRDSCGPVRPSSIKTVGETIRQATIK